MPPPMLKNLIPDFDFNSRTIGATFVNGARERLGLGDLRTDVHLHADDADVPHSCGALVNRRNPIQRNAEFVLA